jgi:hypothetical protein
VARTRECLGSYDQRNSAAFVAVRCEDGAAVEIILMQGGPFISSEIPFKPYFEVLAMLELLKTEAFRFRFY